MYIAIQITSADLACASALMSCTGTAVVRTPHSLTAALVCQRLISAPLSSRTLVHNTFNKMLTAEGEKILELLLGFLFTFHLGKFPFILGEMESSVKSLRVLTLASEDPSVTIQCQPAKTQKVWHVKSILVQNSNNSGLRLWFDWESDCVSTGLFYSEFSAVAIPNTL